MSVEVSIHTRRMRAEAFSDKGGRTNWVDITVIDGRDREHEITVFFDGPNAGRKAQAYANAINAVDQQFHGFREPA